MKRALITGVTGQDGAYLSKLLLEKGYDVYGTFRRSSTPNFWRLQSLNIFSKINLIPADLVDMGSIMEAVKVSQPDEFYNLAASSFVSTAFEQPVGNAEITGIAVTKILETIRFLNPKIKFYQASSSEMYGNVGITALSEKTQFNPASPYAASKLYGHWMTDIYRKAYGIFACSGILFNHESPLRGLEFVSRKITNAVAKIKLGIDKKLVLGNLNAKRDWGLASEYMEGIYKIMQYKKPETFVISTNESHSVKEFVELAFDNVNLDWKKYVKTDKRFMRPLEVNYLQGNNSKSYKKLKWKPKVKFEKLVDIMLKEDLSRWESFLNGKSFPWDAPLYPDENKIITRSSEKNKNSSSQRSKLKNN